ncbi:MAG TPA: tetratricopeptide repeat protein [Flavobacteriales bacterium]|nr:tetratricopeptide repeat protein [Flavobacteriales bacterium]HIO67471.1 tetratricopeptide repeat protein [Flavobacteriales bacterium]
MISSSKGQVIAVISALALAAVIVVLPKTVPFDADNQKVDVEGAEETLEMQITEGISSVLQSEAPMQGIMMLRQVLEKEPGNVKANLALAVFSVVSGQYEKAFDRFQQVLNAEQKDEGAAKFLAQVYAREGKIDMIIGSMTKYKTMIEDEGIQSQVDDIINELNNI